MAIPLWTDSYKTKNRVSVAPKNSWTVFIGNNDPKNPLISSLYGDLKDLSPIYINSGEDDELFEDGEKFYKKAKESGVDITFKAGERMIHCYPILAPMFKEATEAMDEIIGFIKKQLKIK